MIRAVRTPALLFFSVLSGGCTAMARMEAPSLNGTPDSTGVVVVEPDITVIAALFGIRSEAKPVGGLLVRVDGAPWAAPGGASQGYVVFPDLKPGRWQLVSIEAEWQSGNNSVLHKELEVPPDAVDAFTFEVRAGEPIYVGAEIDEDMSSFKRVVRYSVRDEPKAERVAWEWMGDVYAKSAWSTVFLSKAETTGTKQ